MQPNIKDRVWTIAQTEDKTYNTPLRRDASVVPPWEVVVVSIVDETKPLYWVCRRDDANPYGYDTNRNSSAYATNDLIFPTYHDALTAYVEGLKSRLRDVLDEAESLKAEIDEIRVGLASSAT